MSLLENMQNEPVSRLALRKPVTARPNDSVRSAIEAMQRQDLGCAIVVNNDNKPVGMLTEAAVTSLVAHDPTAVDQSVEAHKSTQWPWVKLSDPIADVLSAMEFKNVRFLPVVDDSGRLAGLTGQKGLMEYIADHFPDEVCVQRIGGAPFPLEREGA